MTARATIEETVAALGHEAATSELMAADTSLPIETRCWHHVNAQELRRQQMDMLVPHVPPMAEVHYLFAQIVDEGPNVSHTRKGLPRGIKYALLVELLAILAWRLAL